MKVNYKKAILGTLTFFPVLILFFLDRLIIYFLFWQSSPKISEFFQELNLIKLAVYRVGGIFGAWLLYHLFKLIF